MDKAKLAIIGGLSVTSKMPSYSYNLPISTCSVGQKLMTNSKNVCHYCYADKGFYNMLNVQLALKYRKIIVTKAITEVNKYIIFRDTFSEILNTNYNSTFQTLTRTGAPPKRDGRYFRWHDSGDLMSVTHLQLIADIAEECPKVAFWLPTKEILIVKEFVRLNVIPENLMIRISLPVIEQKEPVGLIKQLVEQYKNINYSYITRHDEVLLLPSTDTDICPSQNQDHKCKGCRRCWHSNPSVGYILH